MKINLSKEIMENSQLSNVVISCLTNTVTTELIKTGTTGDGIVCDLKLTVNEHELDFRALIERWQNQISRMVKEKAKEIVEEKFRDIDELFYDLEERLKPEIEKRMEDWERDIDNG